MSQRRETILLLLSVFVGIIIVVITGFMLWKEGKPALEPEDSDNNFDFPCFGSDCDSPTKKIILEKSLTGHSGQIYSIAISNNRKLLAVGTNSNTPEVWNLEQEPSKKTFSTNISSSQIGTVAISQDNRFLVGAGWGGEGRIYVWEIEKDTNNIYKTLPRQNYNTTSLAINSQNTIIASGSSKGEIKLWDLERGSLKTSIDKDLGKITFLAFTPEDESLIIGDSNGKIIFWNQKGNRVAKELYNENNSGEITSIDFNIDQKILVSSHNNSIINIWDIESGDLLKSLNNQNKVTSLLIGKNRKTIISGDNSGLINIWYLENKKPIKSYELDDYSNENITLKTENNQNIIVISYVLDTIKIWRLEDEFN